MSPCCFRVLVAGVFLCLINTGCQTSYLSSSEFPSIDASEELLVVVRMEDERSNRSLHQSFKDRVSEVFNEMNYPGEVVVRSWPEDMEKGQPHIDIVVYQWRDGFCSLAGYLTKDGVKTRLGMVKEVLNVPVSEQLPPSAPPRLSEISSIRTQKVQPEDLAYPENLPGERGFSGPSPLSRPEHQPIIRLNYWKPGTDEVARMALRELYHELLPYTDLEKGLAYAE